MRPFGLMGPSLPLRLPFFLRGLLSLGLGLTLNPVTSHFNTLNYICKDTLLNKLAFTGSGWTYLFLGGWILFGPLQIHLLSEVLCQDLKSESQHVSATRFSSPTPPISPLGWNTASRATHHKLFPTVTCQT